MHSSVTPADPAIAGGLQTLGAQRWYLEIFFST